MLSDKGELPAAYIELVNQNPLMRFSIYTDLQVKTVRALGRQIVERLDAAIADAVDAPKIQEASGLFWLWTLGSYEIVRTMVQAKVCFPPTFHAELVHFKRELARARIPFAKQELRRKKGKRALPVSSELSITGVNKQAKDLSYNIEQNEVSIRRLIIEFERIFTSATPADVISDHRDAYL